MELLWGPQNINFFQSNSFPFCPETDNLTPALQEPVAREEPVAWQGCKDQAAPCLTTAAAITQAGWLRVTDCSEYFTRANI